MSLLNKFKCAADPRVAADLDPNNPIWSWTPDNNVQIHRLERGRPSEIIMGECFMREGCHVTFNYDVERQTMLGDLIVRKDYPHVVRCVTVDVKRNAFITDKVLGREYGNEMWIVFNVGADNYTFAVRLTPETRAAMRRYESGTKDQDGNEIPGYYVIFRELLDLRDDVVLYGDRYAPSGCEFIRNAVNMVKEVQQDIQAHTGWTAYSEIADRGKYMGRHAAPEGYFDSLKL